MEFAAPNPCSYLVVTPKPLIAQLLTSPHDVAITYLFPLAAMVVATAFVIWYLRHHQIRDISEQLKTKTDLLQQLSHERDLAQEELFRRLYQERELNKEKTQFQAPISRVRKIRSLGAIGPWRSPRNQQSLVGYSLPPRTRTPDGFRPGAAHRN